MTLRKSGVAAIAAIAALVGGLTLAGAAEARPHHGGGRTTFSLSIGGPAYGYGYGYRPYGYGYAQPYYAPPVYYGYRYPTRYRTCDRWVWDGWRRAYVLVRDRC